MVVALTDGISGQLGTTVHTALFALWMAYVEKKNSLVMSVQPGRHDLEIYLTGLQKMGRWESGNGIEALRKLVKAGFADREGIKECVTELGKHLDLLPEQFYDTNQRTLRDYKESMDEMLEELEKQYDFIFCDVGDENGELADIVIGRADLMVRGIGQNTKDFLECFEESKRRYKNIPVFYMVGCYDAESKYNIHNLRHCYRELGAANSACLSYCTEIRDACLDGKLLAVFEKWRAKRTAAPLNGFFKELQAAAGKLVQAGKEGRRDEKEPAGAREHRAAYRAGEGIY